jgi:circadian clock protein KaiC
MRLLAESPLRYRRQILALKHFFATRPCTVLLLDDKTSEPGDLQLHSIAHGVVSLEQVVQEFGAERRRLRIVKMRGQKFQGGSHDFVIDTGRVAVFPRLVAARHRTPVQHPAITTGLRELDHMLGGGLAPGTSTLFIGPSGIGKTTTAVHCMHAALQRGEKAVYYVFDEGISTLLLRSAALGMDLGPYLDNGSLNLVAIDPAELSPGEFACRVVDAVSKNGASFVAIDSLNAYLQAMSGQSLLLLHMHELLTFLSFQNATTILIVGQHGVVGNRSDLDLSYLSDAVVAFKFFESAGALRSAITAVKSRTFENQRTIREFRLSSEAGLQVGAPLVGFQGILGGLTEYRGATELLTDRSR